MSDLHTSQPARGLIQRNRAFRNLWLAQAGSSIGDWFNQVALAQVTLTLTGSPAEMGWVLLCRALPAIVLGPLLSPLVDRYSKRRLLFGTDLLRAVLALSFAFAVFYKMAAVLFVSSFLIGLAGVLFTPARRAAIPDVVDRDDLAEANALDSGMFGLNSFIGAVLGGVVAAFLSPVVCFAINSLSYLLSAYWIRQTHWQETSLGATQRIPYGAQLREGFQEVSRNKTARAILLIGISWGLAGGGYYVLIPVLGQTVYGMGGLGIGLLYAIDGLGVLIGGYLVKRWIGSNHVRAVRWYGMAYLTQALFLAGVAQFTSLGVGAWLLLLMRISSGIIIPLDSYLLQTSVEPHLLGRVSTLHVSTYGGVMQLSYALSGLAVEHGGVPLTGGVIGGVSFLCGMAWLIQKRGPSLRQTGRETRADR